MTVASLTMTIMPSMEMVTSSPCKVAMVWPSVKVRAHGSRAGHHVVGEDVGQRTGGVGEQLVDQTSWQGSESVVRWREDREWAFTSRGVDQSSSDNSCFEDVVGWAVTR